MKRRRLRRPKDPAACRSCGNLYPPNEHAAYGCRCEDCFADEQKEGRTSQFWVYITNPNPGRECGGGRRVRVKEAQPKMLERIMPDA